MRSATLFFLILLGSLSAGAQTSHFCSALSERMLSLSANTCGFLQANSVFYKRPAPGTFTPTISAPAPTHKDKSLKTANFLFITGAALILLGVVIREGNNGNEDQSHVEYLKAGICAGAGAVLVASSLIIKSQYLHRQKHPTEP